MPTEIYQGNYRKIYTHQQLNNKRAMFWALLWLFLILVLGIWWLMVIFHLSSMNNQSPSLFFLHKIFPVSNKINVTKMILYEGSTFIILLILLSFFLLRIYFRDLRKAKALAAFFASVTHELKTPLSSIRLQSEVMSENLPQVFNDQNIENLSSPSNSNGSPLIELVNRLVEDTHKLETELDKILELSRLERTRGHEGLHLRPINLSEIVQNFFKRHQLSSSFEFQLPKNADIPLVWADKYALEVILRNLIDNSKKHLKLKKSQKIIRPITISFEMVQYKSFFSKFNFWSSPHKNTFLRMTYCDHGPPFEGDIKRLGELFYTLTPHQGTGIGLYLVRQMMKLMGGHFSCHQENSLHFVLDFSSAQHPKSLS
jgi:signal transduction histidine kinase